MCMLIHVPSLQYLTFHSKIMSVVFQTNISRGHEFELWLLWPFFHAIEPVHESTPPSSHNHTFDYNKGVVYCGK